MPTFSIGSNPQPLQFSTPQVNPIPLELISNYLIKKQNTYDTNLKDVVKGYGILSDIDVMNDSDQQKLKGLENNLTNYFSGLGDIDFSDSKNIKGIYNVGFKPFFDDTDLYQAAQETALTKAKLKSIPEAEKNTSNYSNYLTELEKYKTSNNPREVYKGLKQYVPYYDIKKDLEKCKAKDLQADFGDTYNFFDNRPDIYETSKYRSISEDRIKDCLQSNMTSQAKTQLQQDALYKYNQNKDNPEFIAKEFQRRTDKINLNRQKANDMIEKAEAENRAIETLVTDKASLLNNRKYIENKNTIQSNKEYLNTVTPHGDYDPNKHDSDFIVNNVLWDNLADDVLSEYASGQAYEQYSKKLETVPGYFVTQRLLQAEKFHNENIALKMAEHNYNILKEQDKKNKTTLKTPEGEELSGVVVDGAVIDNPMNSSKVYSEIGNYLTTLDTKINTKIKDLLNIKGKSTDDASIQEVKKLLEEAYTDMNINEEAMSKINPGEITVPAELESLFEQKQLAEAYKKGTDVVMDNTLKNIATKYNITNYSDIDDLSNQIVSTQVEEDHKQRLTASLASAASSGISSAVKTTRREIRVMGALSGYLLSGIGEISYNTIFGNLDALDAERKWLKDLPDDVRKTYEVSPALRNYFHEILTSSLTNEDVIKEVIQQKQERDNLKKSILKSVDSEITTKIGKSSLKTKEVLFPQDNTKDYTANETILALYKKIKNSGQALINNGRLEDDQQIELNPDNFRITSYNQTTNVVSGHFKKGENDHDLTYQEFTGEYDDKGFPITNPVTLNKNNQSMTISLGPINYGDMSEELNKNIKRVIDISPGNTMTIKYPYRNGRIASVSYKKLSNGYTAVIADNNGNVIRNIPLPLDIQDSWSEVVKTFLQKQ